jgi:hypothetical protein
MSLADIDKNTIILSRTPYKNEITEASKTELQAIIDADIARFLKAGGNIQKIDYQLTTKKQKEGRSTLDFRNKLL